MTSVHEVMTTGVRTLAPTDTVDRLREMLQLHHIGSVVVVEGEAVVGVVTASDVVEDWEPDASIESLMNRDVLTVFPTAPVERAARLMLEHGVHHLVVTATDGTGLAGVVSSFDLLEAMADVIEVALAVSVPVHTVAPGDGLVVRRRGRDDERRGTIVEVHGPRGLPPYLVSWDDDPAAEPTEIYVVHGGDIPLDGCER